MTDPTAASAPQQIPIDSIVTSPYQARKYFDEQALKELAQTLKDRGLENAILVRPIGDHFELIAGERRWRAARLLGWQTITARVQAADDKEAALLGLIENVQRADLRPIEQAIGYRNMTQPPFSLSQSEIAAMVGKDRTVVGKYISVAKLADLPEGVHRCTSLGLRHLLEICRLPEPRDQADIADQAVIGDLSIEELKALVDRKIGPRQANGSNGKAKLGSNGGPAPGPDPLTKAWAEVGSGGELAWKVRYLQPSQWQFTVEYRMDDDPRDSLVDWFQEMSKALEEQPRAPAIQTEEPDADDEAEQLRAADEHAKRLGRLGRPV